MACAPTPCPPQVVPPPTTVSYPGVPTPAADPSWATTDEDFCGPARVYYSTVQSFTDTCSDPGDGGSHNSITVVIPAYTYSSATSQFNANALALADATAQVAALRALYPCVGSSILIGIEGGADSIGTEDGRSISTY